MRVTRVLSLLTALLLVVGVSSASASTISMRLTSGATTTTIADNVAPDLDPTTGYITFINHTFAGWDIAVTTGTGEGVAGNPLGGMDLTYNVSSASAPASPLTILFTMVGVTPGYGGWTMHIGGTQIGGLAVTYEAFYDNSNTAFGTATQIDGALGPSTPPSYNFDGSGVANAIPLYSLTMRLTFTNLTGQNTGDANLRPVPEPGTMVLLGAGLLGIAAVARRRMAKS